MSRVYKSTSIDPSVTNDDMSAMSKMLNQLGVSVMDASGQYRNFNSILADVANAEKGMTDSQKEALSTQAAGVIFCSLNKKLLSN